MKHEITTELRNTLVNVLLNAITKFTFLELQELIGHLQRLPITEEEKPVPSPDVAQCAMLVPEKK